MLTAASSVVVIASVVSAAVGPGAQAQVVTCQGQAATIVGPSDGQNTTGTEGDDVIVAPLGPNSTVQGLGGNDTICLVDGPGGSSRDPFVIVQAGAGNDSVVNETTQPHGIRIELGAGADHFVGADYSETVHGAWPWDPNGLDTEADVFDTRGGNDYITSGSAGVMNQDVISTGAGRDTIGYGGAGGPTLDNGPGADALAIMGPWAGGLTVDNVARRASLGDQTVVTWTAVDAFSMAADPGSHVTFVGSDADETLTLYGSFFEVAAPAAVTTGAGDDSVRLENYLPSRVDTGEGYDSLTYLACDRATVWLEGSARCTTTDGREVTTIISGVDFLFARTRERLRVRGTAGPDRVSAFARHVVVRSSGGGDLVYADGRRTAKVVGGRGDDKLRSYAHRGGIVLGGRGSDVIRGGSGPDRLLGGRGKDSAWGQQGRDRCVAEVRHSCELR